MGRVVKTQWMGCEWLHMPIVSHCASCDSPMYSTTWGVWQWQPSILDIKRPYPLIYLENDWRWLSCVIIYAFFKRWIAMLELCKWCLTPRWGTDTYPMHNDQLSYVLGRKGSTRQKLARASGTWDATFWRVWHGWYSNGLPVDPEDRWYLTNLDENHQPKSCSVKTSCFCFLPAEIEWTQCVVDRWKLLCTNND